MSYLALDQSPSLIGWALGKPSMAFPDTGVRMLPASGPKHAVFLAAARDWLRTMLDGVDEVLVEHTFFGVNPEVFARSAKLIGAIELECFDRGVRCREVQADDWRKHFIGFCRAPGKLPASKRRQLLKDEAMKACVERGWTFVGEHDAEACGILDYALCCDFPDYATKGRLFA